ncbi:MAG: type IIA DNA topoisomerase subunit B [Deltaproteobacteria bacterium]|nr:type IIA DNA topoisomerase subunit B [Deltaproteobacteria bacterium]MBN2672489.1 type IIA DNA topoisomerase subunit B [Deltaproteobacteria bacterium]
MATTKVAYDEKAVQTLDALQHIRKRTGMYIGRIGNGSNPVDGIYIMLKEVIDNSIDEFIMGNGKRIEVTLNDSTVSIRDYGRGIPLGKLVDCVSEINTGAKYNDDVFQFSVGLNGVGTKAVNALSSYFEVISYRDGKFKRAVFSQGEKLEEESGSAGKERNGTFVSFTPDPEIFNSYVWKEDFIEHRLRYYAYLNTGLTILYNGKKFFSQNGLQDLLSKEIGDERTMYDCVTYANTKIEFAFTHTHAYGENYFSFVNGQHTSDGGTHESAFREGILKGVNEFSKKNYAGSDVRDGLVGAIAVKVQDPVFESQTKNKLGSTDVRSWILKEVKDHVVIWLHKNPKDAEKLLEKVKQNEKLRKELSSIKKQAKERAKKVAIRIPKLIDCKIHFCDEKPKGKKNPDRREETLIFLTEGDSAGGAMVQSRDVYTQAIFSLKGKPLNCFDTKRDALYKNEELYNIMRALGIENDMEGLRYNKIVIATDADVDGMHIRNLLITFFLRYFEELVVKGHLHILETPLFRVRNKKETIYCYSEAERDKAMHKLKNHEVTRFKGLGEISPKEFNLFIGDKIRLEPITVDSLSEISSTLEFFMGKNTPERREFIENNLISDIAVG